MFYANADTEKKYGWDLTNTQGPEAPPGKKYKKEWNDLKTIEARKARVNDYAEHMIKQEAAANFPAVEGSPPTKKVKTASGLGSRANDYAEYMTKQEAAAKVKEADASAPTIITSNGFGSRAEAKVMGESLIEAGIAIRDLHQNVNDLEGRVTKNYDRINDLEAKFNSLNLNPRPRAFGKTLKW